MIPSEVINELARTNEYVRRLVSDYSTRIFILSEAYRILGNQFTFSANGELDGKVNRLLVELSDSILKEMESSARKVVEDDQEETLLWARNRTDAQTTIDKYSSHLKFILEGWLAIAYVNNISKGRLITLVMSYMENPYITPLWQDAFKNGADYASDIIRSGGYHWGKGTPISPVKGMTTAGAHYVSTAYHKGVNVGFGKAGAIGYRVHRGSNYDCSVCDEVVAHGIYPLTEIVLPVHPRCMCWEEPVFAEDID